MKKQSTRDSILEAALSLFADRGYDAVGVDEIAESIGKTGPSIYRHFKGKEEIFTTLIQDANTTFDSIACTPELVERFSDSYDAMEAMVLEVTKLTLFDPKVVKLRRLFIMEQYRGVSFPDIIHTSPISAMEDFMVPILARMMEKGILLRCEPRIAAFQLVAPIGICAFFYDRERKPLQVFPERIYSHLAQYRTLYEIK